MINSRVAFNETLGERRRESFLPRGRRRRVAVVAPRRALYHTRLGQKDIRSRTGVDLITEALSMLSNVPISPALIVSLSPFLLEFMQSFVTNRIVNVSQRPVRALYTGNPLALVSAP